MHKHKHWLHAVAITFPQKMEHVRDDWKRLSLGNHSSRYAHDIDKRVEYHATGCYQFDASPLRKKGGGGHAIYNVLLCSFIGGTVQTS